MLNLRAPANGSTFSEALKVADPTTFKDAWKLADGFVASEGLDILPHISKSRPNLVENHMSLVLHCLLKCDLPNVLVKVITATEENSLSVSATVLLGELLHLANLLLPREVNVISHCLPGLLKEVSSLDPPKATRAQEAVAALQKLHAIKKRGPKASSLFLDQILANSGLYRYVTFFFLFAIVHHFISITVGNVLSVTDCIGPIFSKPTTMINSSPISSCLLSSPTMTQTFGIGTWSPLFSSHLFPRLLKPWKCLNTKTL